MSGCECKPDAKRKRDSAQPQETGAARPQSVDKRCRRSHGRVERFAMDGPLVSRYLTLGAASKI